MADYRLRAINDSDLAFLAKVYLSTRWQEMQQAPWDDDQRRAFLQQQFEAQHQHYQEHFPNAEYAVIYQSLHAVGRLYVDQRQDEVRIVDIALLPEHCGQGLGGNILQDIISAANAKGKPVRIHVEKTNPAMRLYKRLGFYVIKDVGIYDLMEFSGN